MLRGYHKELGYREDHTRLPLSMDGRLLSRISHTSMTRKTKSVIYRGRPGIDPDGRTLFLQNWQIFSSKGKITFVFNVQDITALIAHAQLLPTRARGLRYKEDYLRLSWISSSRSREGVTWEGIVHE